MRNTSTPVCSLFVCVSEASSADTVNLKRCKQLIVQRGMMSAEREPLGLQLNSVMLKPDAHLRHHIIDSVSASLGHSFFTSFLHAFAVGKNTKSSISIFIKMLAQVKQT
jgi:hypothetical protein